jgi:hypothetical protein
MGISLLKSFYFIAFVSIAVKFLIALTCHRADMDSWDHVSLLYLMGENIYESTSRYNYGPIWFLVLGALRKIHFFFGLPTGPEGYHSLIALFLSFFDFGIALILKKKVSERVSILYLINPITIFISGFLVQFEQFSIFFALLSAFCFIEKSKNQLFWRIAGCILLGFSLSIKHIFILFPIWLLIHLFINEKRIRFSNFILVAAPYFIFLFFPLYWLQTDLAKEGFRKSVINYTSNYLDAPVPKILEQLGLLNYIEKITLIPETFGGYKALWFIAIVILGWHFRHRNLLEKFSLYCLSFLALSPSIYGQYHLIALIYVLINLSNPFSKLFLVASTTFHLLFFLNKFTYVYGIPHVPYWTRTIIEGYFFAYVPVFFLLPLLIAEIVKNRQFVAQQN